MDESAPDVFAPARLFRNLLLRPVNSSHHSISHFFISLFLTSHHPISPFVSSFHFPFIPISHLSIFCFVPSSHFPFCPINDPISRSYFVSPSHFPFCPIILFPIACVPSSHLPFFSFSILSHHPISRSSCLQVYPTWDSRALPLVIPVVVTFILISLSLIHISSKKFNTFIPPGKSCSGNIYLNTNARLRWTGSII